MKENKARKVEIRVKEAMYFMRFSYVDDEEEAFSVFSGKERDGKKIALELEIGGSRNQRDDFQSAFEKFFLFYTSTSIREEKKG